MFLRQIELCLFHKNKKDKWLVQTGFYKKVKKAGQKLTCTGLVKTLLSSYFEPELKPVFSFFIN